LELFGHLLQLICCTYLLTLSISNDGVLKFRNKSQVMRVEINSLIDMSIEVGLKLEFLGFRSQKFQEFRVMMTDQ